MATEVEKAAIESLFEYVRDLIYDYAHASLDPDALPEDFRNLGQGLVYFGTCVNETRALTGDVARGNLETNPISPGNELASDIKSLQATLKHLTWQIGQIAKGDYKQRVSFIGDFSDAINDMTEQLDDRNRILRQIAEENERKADEMESLAYFDALTGAHSRHYGMRQFEKWLQAGEHFIICFVDMDSLKYVNDTYGHKEGDTYILSVTELLRSIKNEYVLARIGGDEFMILVKDWTQSEAEENMERMRKELIASSTDLYTRSVSYGVIEVLSDEKRSASLLLSLADEIMYEYKRTRKMERRPEK
jgi:diguanylate cyclase (GGDEF)-like protein